MSLGLLVELELSIATRGSNQQYPKGKEIDCWLTVVQQSTPWPPTLGCWTRLMTLTSNTKKLARNCPKDRSFLPWVVGLTPTPGIPGKVGDPTRPRSYLSFGLLPLGCRESIDSSRQETYSSEGPKDPGDELCLVVDELSTGHKLHPPNKRVSSDSTNQQETRDECWLCWRHTTVLSWPFLEGMVFTGPTGCWQPTINGQQPFGREFHSLTSWGIGMWNEMVYCSNPHSHSIPLSRNWLLSAVLQTLPADLNSQRIEDCCRLGVDIESNSKHNPQVLFLYPLPSRLLICGRLEGKVKEVEPGSPLIFPLESFEGEPAVPNGMVNSGYTSLTAGDPKNDRESRSVTPGFLPAVQEAGS